MFKFTHTKFYNMNAVIDKGNSYTKVAIYKNNKIVVINKYNNTSVDLIKEFENLLTDYKHVKKVILSDVSNNDYEFDEFLTKYSFLYIKLNSKTNVPIKNLYKTKDTLGKDRLAAVVGANNIFPNNNVLIFDAGTAITVDFINSKQEYIGGNISPGILMRYKALNSFTGKLPLLQPDKSFNKLIGQTTNEAVKAGVQNSVRFEIQAYISYFESKYSDLKIIFTGGDNIFFENKFKNNIFAFPNLVMFGLNTILEYNAK